MIEELTESIAILDQVTIVLSAISMAFSFLVWLKLRKQKAFDSQRINIRVVVPGTDKYIALWSKPERKHLTRAEVLGLIGLIPRHSKENYKIAYLNTLDFFQHLADVQDDGDNNLLSIECTEQELLQFNLDKARA
jgi:hypothetical protein